MCLRDRIISVRQNRHFGRVRPFRAGIEGLGVGWAHLGQSLGTRKGVCCTKLPATHPRCRATSILISGRAYRPGLGRELEVLMVICGVETLADDAIDALYA